MFYENVINIGLKIIMSNLYQNLIINVRLIMESALNQIKINSGDTNKL